MSDMGYWNASSMDEMDFEIPTPHGDVVYESSTLWDQHVMEIDYDVRTPNPSSSQVLLIHDSWTRYLKRYS